MWADSFTIEQGDVRVGVRTTDPALTERLRRALRSHVVDDDPDDAPVAFFALDVPADPTQRCRVFEGRTATVATTGVRAAIEHLVVRLDDVVGRAAVDGADPSGAATAPGLRVRGLALVLGDRAVVTTGLYAGQEQDLAASLARQGAQVLFGAFRLHVDDDHGPFVETPPTVLHVDRTALDGLADPAPGDAQAPTPGRRPLVAWLRAGPPDTPATPRSPAQAATEEYRHLAPPWSAAVTAMVQVAQRVPTPSFPQDLLDGAVARLLAPPDDRAAG
ncbi:MAG: hypothetical protein MUF83_09285 [Acidimicrobiales bacterium]|nr:hypothetical protein [Acidimicrobiales bacterium]